MREKFGSDFPWLFPNWRWIRSESSISSWSPKIVYSKEQLKCVRQKLNLLLKRLIEEHDIRTRNGELAHVT